MKKSSLLILFLFTLSLSMCYSAEIKIFDKFDDEYRFSIQGGYCYNFGDSIIFYGMLWDNSKDSIMQDSYLFYYYNNEFTKYGLHEIIQDTIGSYNQMTGFLKDKENNYWFSFDGGGLYKLSGSTYTAYDSLIKSNNIMGITSMEFGDNMNLYLSSSGNLYKWDGVVCKKINNVDLGKYFNTNYIGSKLIKLNNNLYFINQGRTVAYIDLLNDKIDTLNLNKFINKPIYKVYHILLFNNYLYMTYVYDENLHFAKFDGENFTNLDFYFDLINDGNPLKHIVNLAVDKDMNFYFKIMAGGEPKGDSIYVIDKDLKKSSIYYRNIGLTNEITLSHAITLSNGEVYLPIGHDGFVIITNPTSVETPSNLLFMNRLYPNPAHDRFSIDFGVEPVNLGSMKVEIYDYLGRSPGELYPEIVYDSSTGKGTMKCEAGNLPKGMYIVVLSNGKYNRVMTLFLN